MSKTLKTLLKKTASIDYGILMWIQKNMHNKFLENAMAFFTRLGNGGMVWLFICAALLYFERYKDYGIIMVISLAATTFFVNFVVKPVSRRERPFDFKEEIKIRIKRPFGSSFPSGHAASSLSCAYVLTAINIWMGIAGVVLACVIAFSRLYLKVHYLSDIIGGAIIGILMSAFVLFVYK